MSPVEIKDLDGLVGQEVGVSDWLLRSPRTRVNEFADATGDHQWIHVDVERATREIGGPIAHGYLTLSLIPHPVGGPAAGEGRDARASTTARTRCASPTWCGSASACACARS